MPCDLTQNDLVFSLEGAFYQISFHRCILDTHHTCMHPIRQKLEAVYCKFSIMSWLHVSENLYVYLDLNPHTTGEKNSHFYLHWGPMDPKFLSILRKR